MSAQEDKKIEVEKYIEELYRNTVDGKISRDTYNTVLKIYNDNIDTLSFIQNIKYDKKNSKLYKNEDVKLAVDGIEKVMIGYIGTVVNNDKKEKTGSESNDDELKAYEEYLSASRTIVESLKNGDSKNVCYRKLEPLRNVHYAMNENHLGLKKVYNAVTKVFKSLPHVLNRQDENIRKRKVGYTTKRVLGYTFAALLLGNLVAPAFGLLALGNVYTVTRLVLAIKRKDVKYPDMYNLDVKGKVLDSVKELNIKALKTLAKLGKKSKDMSLDLKLASKNMDNFASENEKNSNKDNKTMLMRKIKNLYNEDEVNKINEMVESGKITSNMLNKIAENVSYGRNLLTTSSNKNKKVENNTKSVNEKNDLSVKTEEVSDTLKSEETKTNDGNADIISDAKTNEVKNSSDNKEISTKSNSTVNTIDVDNSIIYDLAICTDRAYRSYKSDKNKFLDASFNKGMEAERLYDSLSAEQIAIFESMEKISKTFKEVRKFNDKFRENKYVVNVLEVRSMLDDFRIDFNNNTLAKSVLAKIGKFDDEDLKRAFDNELKGYYEDVKNAEMIVKINDRYAAGVETAKKRKNDLIEVTNLLTKYFSTKDRATKLEYEEKISEKINTLNPIDAEGLKGQFGNKMDKFIK